jgi:hypothetical protein
MVFLQHVDKESQFDGRSVLFLGDFGIGNTMEKNSALESANSDCHNYNYLGKKWLYSVCVQNTLKHIDRIVMNYGQNGRYRPFSSDMIRNYR